MVSHKGKAIPHVNTISDNDIRFAHSPCDWGERNVAGDDEITLTAGSPCGPQEGGLVSTAVGHNDLRIGELRFAQRDDLDVVPERFARRDELSEILTDASELEEGGGKQKDSQQTNKSIVTSNRLRPVWNSVGVD